MDRSKSFISRLISINKYFDNNKTDIVVSFMDGVNISLLLSFFIFNNKTPVVISERNVPWLNLNASLGKIFGPCVQFLQFLIYRTADALVVQTDDLKEWASCQWKKLYIEKITNPVSLKREFNNLGFEKRKKYDFLSCGRLIDYKDHATIIDAFHEIKNKISKKSNLYIIGSGPEKEKLINQIRKLKLNDRVFIIDRTNNIEEYYLNSNIFILASWFEGVPNVILESMTFSLPVISSNYFGVNEIIEDNKSGILFNMQDPKNLSEKMLYLYLNSNERKIIAKNAYFNVEKNNNIEKISKKWFHIFNIILKKYEF